MHDDHNAVEVHASGRKVTPVWLIAGVTGRALAQSAQRGGYRVSVLDCFADRDCARAAVECRSVSAPNGLRFDAKALLREAEREAPIDESIGVVYGSGFESRPGLLGRVAAGRTLYGNSPSIIRLLKDPRRFFPLLARLGIAHPRTHTTAPARPRGWLAKETGGAGGVHIRPAATATPTSRTYYQRIEQGRSMSVTFLADGTRAAIVGINQQWTSQPSYQFGGAVGGIPLSRALHRDIASRLNRLVEATGMVGLNGLDFLLAGDRWSVLEVNPRPPATMELYDRDYPRGLFDWHIRSCRGELPLGTPRSRSSRALAIVTAPEAWQASEAFRFPGWCRDLPRYGLSFSAGDPVCTVHASAATPRAAMQLVWRRQARLALQLSRKAVAA